jgi:DNA-binding SARP family transcriptional activator
VKHRDGDSVEFRILGPLEVTAGSERLDLGGARQQIVLATLLLGAGKVVSVDRLLEAVYGEDLPHTARTQAQMTVSSLRRLFAAHGDETAISSQPQGYVLQVGGGWLDSGRFTELVAAAGVARESGDLDQAVAGLRDALRLWRGPALEGIDSQLIRAAASRLDEERIAAIEIRLALELDLGRHHELAGELAELVGEFPLREGLRGQLMLALYRCGRTAEALAAYRQARQTMIEELGIEPGERLQQLERAILNSDPVLAPEAGPVTILLPGRLVPRLLPAGIADFTGRTGEIGQIRCRLKHAAGEEHRIAVPVVVIAGKGGVGKTSIAVRASHEMAGHFADGQLFADLHGGTSRPVSAAEVLQRFLRALGVPGAQVPDGLDERAEMYRNLVAGRKILVVLDDAAGEGQVSPLLPGGGAAAVMITSRSRLAGLAGAVRIEVDGLDAGGSVDLLARIIGAERVAAQPEAAAAVAQLCGHLPLALRIAGARLSARPHWGIQQLAERLADETRRLDELTHADMGIRASISLSYESVGEQARRLFRRLALWEAPTLPGWLGAALLAQPLASAGDLLDELIAAQLVEVTGAEAGPHARYRFHDLIRVFARERLAAEEPPAVRKAALERALGALLCVTEEAYRRYYGSNYVTIRIDAPRWPLPSRLLGQQIGDPLSWYERERAGLVSGVRQAAQAGLAELCWSLAFAAVPLIEARAYLDDWREIHELALQATRQAHHARGQAAMRYSLGALHLTRQRFDQARQEFAAAEQLFQDAGDYQGKGLAACRIAYLDLLSGRLDDSARRCAEALAIFRRTGDRVAEAYVLQNMACIKLERQDPDEAKRLLSGALRLCRAARAGRIEAGVLNRMGEVHLRTGEFAHAVASFEGALAVARDLHDLVAESMDLLGIGVAKLRQGEFDQARSALQHALGLAGTAGHGLAEARARLGLSEFALISGDPGQAVALGQQAAGAFQAMGALLDEARTLALLSDAHAALSGSVRAAEATERRAKPVGTARNA